jgi:UDP-2,3-diacylglucosamine hydrolase
MSTLFISDLHLNEHQPAMTQLFLRFLKIQAREAEALYILGDLFETWIGDDNLTTFNRSIIAALAQLTASGVSTYFMPGNRDFLIGTRFIQQTGCHYLTDPTIINLYGSSSLLTHGDSWCSLDKNYQRFRRFARHRSIQNLFLKLRLSWRQKIVQRLRGMDHAMPSSCSEKYDIVMKDLLQSIDAYPDVSVIIHGHTHQPCVQLIKHQQKIIKRFVLSDWQVTQGNVLVALPDQSFELIYFS